MVPIKHWRTWAEIEEINVAIKAKLEALLQSDGYCLPAGMTLRELKGSNVLAHKRLFKKIKKRNESMVRKAGALFQAPCTVHAHADEELPHAC